MTDDPRADYRDADGVLHRWDGDDNYTGAHGGDWYHPAGIRCRDASCPGNRGALERLGGMPPDATEADASAVRGALHPLITVVGGGVYHPGRDDERHELHYRLAPGVSSIEVHDRLLELVRALDAELRAARRDGTG